MVSSGNSALWRFCMELSTNDVAFALFALCCLGGALMICLALAGLLVAVFDLD